mgnify:CR=1 FL=1
MSQRSATPRRPVQPAPSTPVRRANEFLEEENLRRKAKRLKERLLQDYEGDDEAEEPDDQEPFMEGY